MLKAPWAPVTLFPSLISPTLTKSPGETASGRIGFRNGIFSEESQALLRVSATLLIGATSGGLFPLKQAA